MKVKKIDNMRALAALAAGPATAMAALVCPVAREAQGWRYLPGPVAHRRHFLRVQPYLQ